MQKYDVPLKSLLQAPGVSVLEQLAGAPLARWVNVDLPRVQTARLDLLGETEAGELVHFELQRAHDAAMPLRMAEYALGIYRRFRRFPRQFVLYMGEPELRMAPELTGPHCSFRYKLSRSSKVL